MATNAAPAVGAASGGGGGGGGDTSAATSGGSEGDCGAFSVLTWNIAAVNNNPFEYWIHHTDPKYNKLMAAVADCISSPGPRDIPVGEVFTAEMYGELHARMTALGWPGVAEVAELYERDFSKRCIISGFLKDTTLGKKRLASWPDRLTNTISRADGSSFVCRPTVINCYDRELPSQEVWFAEWDKFMFATEVTADGKRPCDILSPIKRSKYPDVTEEEERISLALQTLCLGIFDAIEVHLMNTSGVPDWFRIKVSIMESMNLGKVARTIELCQGYAEADVMCLQECGRAFLAALRQSPLAKSHHVVASAGADPNRDQNSLVLLRKAVFGPDIREHSEAAFEAFPQDVKVPAAPGDLLLVSAPLRLLGGEEQQQRALIASFHGDTNGLASLPVLQAVTRAAAGIDHAALVFGMDANVYEKAKPGLAPFDEFVSAADALGYETTWGAKLSKQNYTTFNARTYVQPQLNKASTPDDLVTNGDRNPKDFVLVERGCFSNFRTIKDNTGRREYIEGIPFPTLEFPSDHGIVFSRMDVRPVKP